VLNCARQIHTGSNSYFLIGISRLQHEFCKPTYKNQVDSLGIGSLAIYAIVTSRNNIFKTLFVILPSSKNYPFTDLISLVMQS